MVIKQEVNKVVCENEEIKMLNIRNQKKKGGSDRRKERKCTKLRISKFNNHKI